MNFRKLLTYLTMGTAAAMPLAVAQNPTILQGNYITNVFGNSNFVLNPNAQTNTANVTVSSATVTRSTSTPLVATSEFLVTTSTATGSATWSTRTFDAGMKGQNCEARFTYRGFSVGSTTAQILQGANVVAQLTLTASTDPRIASINFPCGDLSSATTFRLQQASASLTGTNEISGIYVGLATNMANVAQAEFVGGGEWNAVTFTRSSSAIQSTFAAFTSGSAGTALGKATSAGSDSTITFSNLPAGQYYVSSNLYAYGYNISNTYVNCEFSIQDIDSNTFSGLTTTGAVPTIGGIYPQAGHLQGNFTFTTSGQRRFRLVSRNGGANGASSSCNVIGDAALKSGIYIYRFPSSSELVVTPERQNVWAAAQFTGGNANIEQSNLNTWNTMSGTIAQSFIPYGSASSSKTACTYGSGTAVNTNDVAICIPVIPPGTYKVTFQTRMTATSTSDCTFRFTDGTTGFGMLNVSSTANNTLVGIIKYNSTVLNRGIAVESFNGGSGGTCALLIASSSVGRTPQFIFEPLDQPSNSALYVQGPVKAAETGAAIPAGYVGEVIEQVSATITTATVSADTEINVTNASITLGVGVWELEYAADVAATRSPASTTLITGRFRVLEGTNVISGMESMFEFNNQTSSIGGNVSTATKRKRILITSGTKTYQLKITCGVASSVGICYALHGNVSGTITGDEASTYIRAVRVN